MMKRILTYILILSVTLSLQSQELPADSLEDALLREHSIGRKVDLQIQLLEIYMRRDPDKATILGREALQLAESVNDNERKGLVYLLLGDLAMQQDSIDLAEYDYQEAIRLLSGTGSRASLIKARLSLGNRYTEKEDYPAAMDQYLNGIRLAEEYGITDQLANLYNNLGVIYINMNNTGKALELYTLALDNFEKLQDTLNIAGTTTNIGSIYMQLGNYDIARQYYNNGLALFEQFGSGPGQAHALFKLGLLAEEENKYTGAIRNLKKSLEVQDSTDRIAGGAKGMFRAETFAHLGACYFETGMIDSAEPYLQEAYELSIKNHQFSLISLTAGYLSKISQQREDYPEAIRLLRISSDYTDSLYNQENVRKLTQLEMQYQFESQLKQARLEKELEEQQRKRNALVYTFITAGLLLGVVIVVLLLRLEKNKKKKLAIERAALSEKLDHTNKELTTYVMYLLRKNELILSIIEKLKKARIEATRENKLVIAELISELQSDADALSWKEFEVRFQEVHTDFYNKLHARFPDLSNNEIRLCAFFRLHMTSKEIAAITYQSLNSIKVARYRLRKKLKLNQDEDLISFLAGI